MKQVRVQSFWYCLLFEVVGAIGDLRLDVEIGELRSSHGGRRAVTARKILGWFCCELYSSSGSGNLFWFVFVCGSSLLGPLVENDCGREKEKWEPNG